MNKDIKNTRIHILRDMDTSKAITKLAIPAIIGFMVMAIYNVADTVFVSWWSYKGVGAVQIIFPIMMISSSIGLMFGIGGGSYISRLLGQGDKHSANSVVTSSLFVSLFIATIFIGYSLVNIRWIVELFGASGNMINLSSQYGRFIIIGSIFVIPSMVLNNSLRAEGSAKYSMIGMALGAIINIIIDPIFIFTFDMGIQGAALATMLSQCLSFSILFQFYVRKKTILKIHPKFFSMNVNIYVEILKIGIPTFFRQMLFSVSMALLNDVSYGVGGDYLLSAIGIAMRVTSLIGFFIFGMGQGLQPVVGYNYGANNMTRVLSAQKHGMRKTFIITLISSIMLMIFAKQILLIFTKQNDVVEYGISAIRALSLALIFMSISNTIAIVFQAIGNAKISMLFSILRQGIFLIPSIIILPTLFHSYGVMYAQFSADILTFIISMIIYIPFLKKEKQILQEGL